ncbi:hypothetical protein IWX90DRAFT_483790 [Phyllosticta citrichinensis]|uniref:Uncharacterized protein n=1 Tax=Phyllosticta citrichinensis TaxID=1130410 RepID=A0ABR1Y423_9PEZI
MANTTSEKTTFGITITRPDTPDKESVSEDASPITPILQEPVPVLKSKPSHASDLSVADPVGSPRYDSSNPFSAFYQHPESRSHLEVKQDVENGLLIPGANGAPLSTATTASQPKVSIDGRVKDCTVWPSKQALHEKAKAAKAQRTSCQWWGRMSKKHRLWAKILIALTIIALAIGLSVGISRAVGGGVWSGTGQSRTIPNNGS